MHYMFVHQQKRSIRYSFTKKRLSRMKQGDAGENTSFCSIIQSIVLLFCWNGIKVILLVLLS